MALVSRKLIKYFPARQHKTSYCLNDPETPGTWENWTDATLGIEYRPRSLKLLLVPIHSSFSALAMLQQPRGDRNFSEGVFCFEGSESKN